MIRLERASASVPGRSRAEGPRLLLDALDLEFDPGESHLVLGANGSGKSTLVRLLAGLRRPASGRVLLDGAPVAPGRAWPRLAVLFEEPDPQFLADTVEGEIAFGLESLALPPDEIRTRTAAAMERWGVAAFARREPWTLSGGEKARVLLAAALAAEPRAIVIDQALAHLDPATRRSLERDLVALASEGRLLVRTHQDADPPFSGETTHVIEERSLRRVDRDGDGPWSASVPYPLAFRVAALFRERGLWNGSLPVTAVELSAGLGGVDFGSVAANPGTSRHTSLHPTSPLATLPHPTSPHPTSPRGAGEAPGDTVIALAQASWSPPGPRPVLAPIDLEVRAGEVVALVGKSGTGKSTILKLVCGLLAPSSGAARVHAPSGTRAAGLALEYPERQLFGRTVEEDVAALLWVAGVPEGERLTRARAALELVGLDPASFASRLPSTLSEGEKRRVAIASLLADHPAALLLDEPTAGLDPEGRIRIAAAVMGAASAGRAVLLASHDLDFVSGVADRVVVLAPQGEGSTPLAIRTPLEIWSDAPLLERAGLPAPEFAVIGETLQGAGWLDRAERVRDGVSLVAELERSLDLRNAAAHDGAAPIRSGA